MWVCSSERDKLIEMTILEESGTDVRGATDMIFGPEP